MTAGRGTAEALSGAAAQALRDALAPAWPMAGAATPPGAGTAALAVAIARDVRVPCVLVVASGAAELESFGADAAAMLGPGDSLRVFPMSSEDAAASPACEAARIRAMAALSARGRDRPVSLVVATCAGALPQRCVDPAQMLARSLRLESGAAPAPPDGGAAPDGPEGLCGWLAAAGYRRAPEVYETGVFASRGGVVDVWPTAALVPSRVEFFGDQVDSIRTFDPSTQRSSRRIDSLVVPPMRPPDDLGALLHERLPDGACVLWTAPEAASDPAAAEARAFFGGRGFRQLFLGLPEPVGAMRARLPFVDVFSLPGLTADMAASGDWIDPDAAEARRAAVVSCAARCAVAGAIVHVWADTDGAVANLRESAAALYAVADLRARPISGGFAISTGGQTAAPGEIWLSQADVFGVAKRAAARRAPREADGPASGGGGSLGVGIAAALDATMPAAAFDRPADSGADSDAAGSSAAAEALASRILETIQRGDYVVHEEYGIGRYLGTDRLEIAGKSRETLVIEYAGGSILHVPLSRANLVSRYSGAGDELTVVLHEIGSKRWAAQKAAAARSIERLAAEMLNRQARRKTLPGRPFAHETPWLAQFEASFPHRETPGQAECIRQVREDMESPHPMDRLVCGDAGYGKTEIAMRAAFISAMQGRQVAVLVPTTVLAQQHYSLFRDRFAPWPVTIALHSSTESDSRRAKVERGLASGAIDIVVGTHGILSERVVFKDLGLLVVDEEQRFGVRQKERLKERSEMVDVLSLSATPIPRSLYLGLVGARDLSLLRTPPPGRVPIRTRVAAKSDDILREAIGRELARGGQVFYLHNRVATLPLVAGQLRQLFPGLRIGMGHGRLPPAETAAAMIEFAEGRQDLFLSTTIVENGIDVPRANTIIVERADRFGVADLYQLRGRVGRSDVQAWAYFLVPDGGAVTGDARQRLEALEAASELGCGVSLAMRDLALRGAGNLLGAEQSGHIAAVGFRLYCQLLRRAVAKLRGEAPPLLVDVELDLPFLSANPGDGGGCAPAFLPESYVSGDSARIDFHRRLAECSSEAELDAFVSDVTDRYGAAPQEARRLYATARLRILAAERGISRIRAESGTNRIFMYRGEAPLRAAGAIPELAGRAPDELLASALRLVSAVAKAAQVPG